MEQKLEKLTKNIFFEMIVGSGFIDAIWYKTLEQVITRLDEIKTFGEIGNCCYIVEKVEKHSNFARMIINHGLIKTYSRRDLTSKNNFYKYGNFLLHVSFQGGNDQIIMINEIF